MAGRNMRRGREHDHSGERKGGTGDLSGTLFDLPRPDPADAKPIPPRQRARILREHGAEPEQPERVAAPENFKDYVPSAAGSATSRAAAEALSLSALHSQYKRVEAFIQSRGPHGATREEIADGTAIPLNTVNPRVVTLYKQGWIGSNPGHTRPTTRESPAEVLLWQDYVVRWKDTQRRPPTREPMK